MSRSTEEVLVELSGSSGSSSAAAACGLGFDHASLQQFNLHKKQDVHYEQREAVVFDALLKSSTENVRLQLRASMAQEQLSSRSLCGLSSWRTRLIQ